PPEPNGFLHIGHAKSIHLNFGLAQEFGGTCNLRFDDTNPETEDEKYVRAAKEDVRWLGYDWDERLYFASDYFEKMYAFAEHLIRNGQAYVDSSSEAEIREARGTVTEPGRPTPYRDRSVEENLDLFRRMRAGEFPDGTHVLRGKIDLASPNMIMRDPVFYRIRHAHHYRRGNEWCIYPLYDYAHCIEDAIECITHSLCTLEFENNREIYDWIVERLPRGNGEFEIPPESQPKQTEFARLALDYTIMSKRKLLQLVNGGFVSGWDDPRMPTIAGMRRRGFTPEAIRSFCDLVGVTKANSRVDIAKLEYAIRDDLNARSPRVMCVIDPLRVVITNWEDGRVDQLEAPYYPHDVPLEGSRTVPFTREIYIERDDFAEEPPKGFFRLAPGREVRLRYGYVIRCDDVVKNDAGEVIELRCSYDPDSRGGDTADGRSVKGTIHWVSATEALPVEVRLYDRLFTVPDPEADEEKTFIEFLNPASLVVRQAVIEPSVRDDGFAHYQFERLGYFVRDPDGSAEQPVFNRTVTLRDTWAKQTRSTPETDGRPQRDRPKQPQPEGTERAALEALDEKRRAAVAEFARAWHIDEVTAEILTRSPDRERLYTATVQEGASARLAANWIVNELPREAGEAPLDELAFDAPQFAAFLKLVENDEINSSAARDVLAVLVAEGGDPDAIIDARGLRQISDSAELESIIADVVEANPDKAEAYRGGRTGLLGFFVGQVMGRSGGRANPQMVRSLLEERLQTP
ncbi:MAG: glutamine--tRNA ligase/YqeY domain fusion protein, partial [Longimicrobiales bacterium]